MTLDQLFDQLDRYDARIPLTELEAQMHGLTATCADVRAVVKFNDEGYARNAFRSGPAYEAIVMCWKDGQCSPIHDHAQSACCVRVLCGEATETTFTRDASGGLQPSGVSRLPEGGTTGSQDADIHAISNAQGNGQELITLHVYSPPLGAMTVYDPPEVLTVATH